MEDLIKYLNAHADRGACQCGNCFVVTPDGELAKVKDPAVHQPAGHTVDMIFFKVSNGVNTAKAADLKALIIKNKRGAFCDLDMFDGAEHGYMEVGGWIGDQGLALTLMGLGTLLGLWKLHTPRTVLGDHLDRATVMQMAGAGLITISAKPENQDG